VFVCDFSDEFLDQVLQGGDARGAAVLIHDHGHLVPAAAQFTEQHVELHRLGHPQRVGLQGGHRDIRPLLPRDGDGLLHVHEPHDVVDAVVGDREAGEPGLPGEVDDRLGGFRAVDARDSEPRRHDVIRGVAAEHEGAREQGRGVEVQASGPRGSAHERAEFLRRARRGQFFLRLDAEGTQDRVGGVVEQQHGGLEDEGERHLERDDELRGLQRQREREILWDKLPDDHRQQRGDGDGDDDRDAPDRRQRQSGRRQRRGQHRADRRLHRVSGEQRRQRDPELRAGEVRRGDLQGADGARQPTFAPRLPGFKLGAVEVDQRELRGDEETCADREEDPDCQKQ
jgi:hypothetical protein